MTNQQKRAAAIMAAIAHAYPKSELTGSGVPKVSAVNERMEPGFDAVTSEERDAAWARHTAPQDADTPAPAKTDADDPDQPEAAEQVTDPAPGPQEGEESESVTDSEDTPPAAEDAPSAAPDAAEDTTSVIHSEDPAPSATELEAIDPASDFVLVTVTRASMSPVPLHVHGLGRFSLPHGKATRVPREALGALADSDVEFTTEEEA